MIFGKKVERAFKFNRERNHIDNICKPEAAERADDNSLSENDRIILEKGDMTAMIISALLVILPAAFAVFGIFCLIGYLFFK